jgi:hypothetical protein
VTRKNGISNKKKKKKGRKRERQQHLPSNPTVAK